MIGWIKRSPVARHVLTLSGGNVIAQAITIAGIPFLSRVYGPSAFGLLAIFVSIATLISVVGTGRYEFAVVMPKQRGDALSLMLISRLLLWLAALASLVVIFWQLQPIATALSVREHAYWLLAIPLQVVLQGEISILNSWHTREKRFAVQARNRIIFSLATVVVQLGLGLFVLPDIRGLVIGLLVAQVFALAFLTIKQGLSWEERTQFDWRRARSIAARFSKMPLLNAPTALLDSVRFNGVNLVIGGQSMAALGQYSMAWRSVQAPLGLIGSSLTQVFFQRMAQEAQGRLEATLRRVTLQIAIGSLPFFLLFFFVAPWLLPLLLGSAWMDSGRFAQALTPWLFLNLVTAPVSTVYLVTETQGRQAVFGVVYTGGALLTLFLLRGNLLMAVWAMSLVMTLLLAGFLVMALVTARAHDRAHARRRAHAQPDQPVGGVD